MSTARHDLAPPAAPGCLLRALAVCLLVLSAVWPAEGRGGLVRVSHATLDGTPRQVLLAEDGAFRGVLRYRGLGCESDPEARRLAVLHGRLLRPLTGVHVVEEGRRIDLAAGEWLEDDDAFPCASLPLALVFEGDGGRTDEVAEADCHAILVTARAPGPGLTLRRADAGSMLVCRPAALERLLEGRPAFV
ncbi:MAG: hypothetical protein JXR77_10460, partial [Lentisphaeria bacterium]|nr:hypothetical protein [Lentisphaeria bacterium]